MIMRNFILIKKEEGVPKKKILKDSQRLTLRKNPDMVTRKIEGETILVPIFRTSEEINYIYTLNKSASRIWDMLDTKNSIQDIKRKTLKEFDATPKAVEKELNGLLKDLKEIKAVI